MKLSEFLIGTTILLVLYFAANFVIYLLFGVPNDPTDDGHRSLPSSRSPVYD